MSKVRSSISHTIFSLRFFLFFSFSFHFRFTNFLLGFTCRSPEVLREVLRFTYFLVFTCLQHDLFLAKCWAARFIISSRAKRACFRRASQGQRDFLLAINLSSLVGVRLDVIQSSDVKVHYGFPGNRLPSMTKLRAMLRSLFMKTGGDFPTVNIVTRESTGNSKILQKKHSLTPTIR